MMSKFAKTIKQLLVRFKQKDFEYIVDNWSVFRSRSLDVSDLSAVGRAKAKSVTAVLEHMKVITGILFVDLMYAYDPYICALPGLMSYFRMVE